MHRQNPRQVLLRRHRPRQVRGLGRQFLELRVEGLQILLLQESIGGRQVADLAPTQCLHQPILQRPVHPLHTPLRLRTSRQDQPHVQRLHRPPKLRKWLFSRQYLPRRRLAVTAINPRPVHIERSRQALSRGIPLQHLEGRRWGLFLKESRVNPACRVVDHHHQHRLLTPALEPVVMRTIHLHHFAKVLLPLTAATMHLHSPLTCPQALRQKPPTQRLHRHHQSLFRQTLRCQRRTVVPVLLHVPRQ